ncbi:MAG: hypothetical protein PVF45_12930 [Anaerolineae bacterium]|jgi:hypothetical protein
MNTSPSTYAPDTIEELVHGLDPVDWVQLELLARLSPVERVLVGMRAQDFARAVVRGAFQRRFPHLSRSELNMKVLAHFTPVRMERR